MLKAHTLDIATTMAFSKEHEAPAKPAKPVAAQLIPGKMKVMIADDSPVYRRIIQDALCAMPFEMIFAASGRQALDLFKKHKPDVVILDRIMPDLTGPELCRILRASSPHSIPYILMLTGSTDKNSVVEGLDAGADDYVTKPFHDAELLARIRVGMRNKELQRQIEIKNRQLEELALSDPLTGLPNRRAIENWAGREFESAARHQFPFWVVMADIDRFKSVNDTFGHAAGDVVLKEFSRILKKNSRSSEICGRLGGEEFSVIFTHTDREGVFTAIERVRAELQATAFTFNGCDLMVTASFGLAGFDRNAAPANLDMLMASADAALYAAKRNGRNRIEIAQPAALHSAPQSKTTHVLHY